jgi:predicted nucleic-acid-binding protein
MHAVDTNVLVRLIARDDAKQTASAEALVAKGAWISHLVLAEATWVLAAAYEVSAEKIAVAVEMLLNHQQLAVQDPDVVGTALDHFRAKPALGFSDCLVLEIARKAGHVPLATFDKALSKLDGTLRL